MTERSRYNMNDGVPGAAPIVPPVYGFPIQRSRVLFLQSYLNASRAPAGPRQSQAVLIAPTNADFVQSTMKEEDDSGYCIALAPWSQTPVTAIVKGAGMANSPGLVMRPGQYHQFDRPFNGFVWGLPVGWLGGGLATILVFKGRGEKPDWEGDRREILFHRFRIAVRASSLTAPVSPPPQNWPTRFPWTEDFRGFPEGAAAFTDNRQQNGQAVLDVEPTRTLLRLRDNIAGATASGAPFRVVWWGTEDFDADNLMKIALTGNTEYYWQSTWPGDPAFTDQNPMVLIPPEYARVGCNAMVLADGSPQLAFGITIEVPAGSALLTAGPAAGPVQVDVLRYGKL